MHAYVLVPLLAGMAAFAVAGAAWGRDPDQLANRLSALFMLCLGAWSLAVAVPSLADSRATALLGVRFQAVGFLWFGPLCVHLHAAFDRNAVPAWLRGALPWLYAATPVGIALYLGTDWFVEDVRRTPRAWLPIFGPAFPLAFAWGAAYPIVFGVQLARGRHRALFARPALAAVPWLLAGLVAFSLVTEVLLPSLGIPFPRFGTAVASLVAARILFGVSWVDHTAVMPRNLAQELLDAFPDGVALLGAGGRIRSANANLGRLAGCPRSLLRGVELARFVPGLPLDSTGSEKQSVFVPEAGSEFPVSLSVSRLQEDGGSVTGYVVAVRDLRPALQLSGHLVATGRLAAVGELAASITHEINNPIAYVRSNLGLLETHLDELAKAATVIPGCDDLAESLREGQEAVADTARGADRVVDIVRDVRSFSGAGHGERETADVSRLCEEALRVCLPRIASEVSVVRDYGDVTPLVCAPQALVQVLLNLLSNAIQAVGESGRIGVATRETAGEVMIQVEDDGAGIPPEVMERIFDPFFTTKPVGEGTGLGLAISRAIITDHGGGLEVVPRPDGGTIFRIRLPVDVPADDPDQPAAPLDDGGGI